LYQNNSLPFEAFNQRGERLVGVIDLKQPGTREVCVMVHGLLCNRVSAWEGMPHDERR
jgi:hypothetical protein